MRVAVTRVHGAAMYCVAFLQKKEVNRRYEEESRMNSRDRYIWAAFLFSSVSHHAKVKL